MTRVADERAVWLANNILPHEPALRAWLSRRKVLKLEIDDIVQETYAVLAGLESVRQVRHPRSYMFSVARSIILQHLRRLHIVSIEAMAEIDGLSILAEEASPEEQVARVQELRQMGELIASLPEKCREAFTLRKVKDLPQREVAQRMGVSENTVEKHIGKATRLLMAAFGVNAPAGGNATGRPENGRERTRGKT